MALLRIFWEVFWQILGIFLMAVSALALLNGARLYWLSRCSVSAEKIELQSLCKHWLWNGVYFLIIGFFIYTSASSTASLFSVPFISVSVVVVFAYLVFKWFRTRMQEKGESRDA